jgi:tRNA 5-methylaminomethyl-2-thiouridine biosynthesis bifunctional protein
VDAAAACEISGVQITTSALHIRTAGYTDPREVVAALLASGQGALDQGVSGSAALRCWYSCTPKHLELNRAGQWELDLSNGVRVQAPNVVVCAAFESHTIPQLRWLPLEPIRGQTALIHPTPTSRQLRTVVCFDGYITPAEGGPNPHPHLLGAHYRHNDCTAEPRHADTAEIIARCARVLPNLSFPTGAATGEGYASRVCFRTSTVDRLPYIGALADFDTMRAQASQFQSGSDLSARVPLQMLRGLYISAGHGSRGLLSCPLGGELLARLITASPLEELAPIAALCAPSRVVYRQLGDR